MDSVDITARIKGIKYKPLLCKELTIFDIGELDKALSGNATSIVRIDDKNQIAMSRWVSPKRTRSYPYARVYDSLSFAGKKATIIPVIKDEGQKGDRDFLQWDTISLMSLIGVYVIIAYYINAEKSPRSAGKITNQMFDIDYIEFKIRELLSYQSDALHWNLAETENIAAIGQNALGAYSRISADLGVRMHSETLARQRILKLGEGQDAFLSMSRDLAATAQQREAITIQPNECLDGTKGTITIENYLGGKYYFTADEVWIQNNSVYLVEAKHTKGKKLPSVSDIKDGLLKMMLFANLESVKIDNIEYKPISVLKLTTGGTLDFGGLNASDKEMLQKLKEEALTNNFRIFLNDRFV